METARPRSHPAKDWRVYSREDRAKAQGSNGFTIFMEWKRDHYERSTVNWGQVTAEGWGRHAKLSHPGKDCTFYLYCSG